MGRSHTPPTAWADPRSQLENIDASTVVEVGMNLRCCDSTPDYARLTSAGGMRLLCADCASKVAAMKVVVPLQAGLGNNEGAGNCA